MTTHNRGNGRILNFALGAVLIAPLAISPVARAETMPRGDNPFRDRNDPGAIMKGLSQMMKQAQEGAIMALSTPDQDINEYFKAAQVLKMGSEVEELRIDWKQARFTKEIRSMIAGNLLSLVGSGKDEMMLAGIGALEYFNWKDIPSAIVESAVEKMCKLIDKDDLASPTLYMSNVAKVLANIGEPAAKLLIKELRGRDVESNYAGNLMILLSGFDWGNISKSTNREAAHKLVSDIRMGTHEKGGFLGGEYTPSLYYLENASVLARELDWHKAGEDISTDYVDALMPRLRGMFSTGIVNFEPSRVRLNLARAFIAMGDAGADGIVELLERGNFAVSYPVVVALSETEKAGEIFSEDCKKRMVEALKNCDSRCIGVDSPQNQENVDKAIKNLE